MLDMLIFFVYNICCIKNEVYVYEKELHRKAYRRRRLVVKIFVNLSVALTDFFIAETENLIWNFKN